MAIDGDVTLAAKLTEKDVYKAGGSTSTATQEGAVEDDGDSTSTGNNKQRSMASYRKLSALRSTEC